MRRHHLLIIFAIPVTILIVVVIMLQFNTGLKYKAEKRQAKHSMTETDRLSNKLDSTIDTFNALKPLVEQTINKIRYYEKLKRGYEDQVITIYKTKVDSVAIAALQNKLAIANNEILRLRGELAKAERPISNERQAPDIKAHETPNEDAIVITLDGNGTDTRNKQIYLIPYSKKVKRYMAYEASCDGGVTNNRMANYYEGVYFFNNVAPGKYLIKICAYYGNYKLINKETGKYLLTMQIAPPVQ